MTHSVNHREQYPMQPSAQGIDATKQIVAQSKKQPFIEPKLTWVEPTLIQQGTLNAAAQSGGFFGSFSP